MSAPGIATSNAPAATPRASSSAVVAWPTVADNRRAGWRLTIFLVAVSALVAASSAAIQLIEADGTQAFSFKRLGVLAAVGVWPVLPALAIVWRWSTLRLFASFVLFLAAAFLLILWRSIQAISQGAKAKIAKTAFAPMASPSEASHRGPDQSDRRRQQPGRDRARRAAETEQGAQQEGRYDVEHEEGQGLERGGGGRARRPLRLGRGRGALAGRRRGPARTIARAGDDLGTGMTEVKQSIARAATLARASCRGLRRGG